jgi:hypothetical protein
MHLPLPDFKQTMGKIKQALKPEGIFFLSVPLARPDLNLSGFDSQGRYFLIMTAAKWSDFLKECGFIEQ